MKKYILIVCFLITSTFSADASVKHREVWNKANELYSMADYSGALDLYRSIENEGFSSLELYYNSANCYFKLKDYGHAILYYERALKFNPADKDIIRNLEISRDYTLDKIDTVPEFIFRTWIRNINYSFSADIWTWSSLIFLAITFLLVLIFRFSSYSSRRRVAVVGAFILFFMTIVSTSFAISQISAFREKNTAIVMKAVAAVKSSPDASGKDIFILHEGTKVKVIDEISPWKRVVLSDGRDGWLSSDSIEII